MKVFTGIVAALLLSASVASSQSSVSAAPSVIHFPYTPVGSSHDTSVTINIYVPYVNGDDQCYIEIKSPAGFTFKTPCFTTFVSDGQNCPGWGGGDGHFSVQITVRYTPTSSSGQGGTITLDVYRGSQYLNPPVEVQSTIVMSGDPLPIQLTSFKATALSGNGISLTWTTVSETNNYGFNVQRNGAPIAFIQGHGTTIEQHTYTCTDNPGPGKHQYRLLQLDLDGTATYSETILVDVTAPSKFALDQNFPNPFNPSTQIAFAITKEGPVTLRVYDILGREMATLVNENRNPGQYTERFDGNQLSSGVYVYVLRSSEGRLVGRMMMLK